MRGTGPPGRRWARGRSKGMSAERRVWRALRELGVSDLETNVPDLPGRPDVVLRWLRRALFVHGCFWHVHPQCSTREFSWIREGGVWHKELARNVLRDEKHARLLEEQRWEVFVVWECETRNRERLREQLSFFADVVTAARVRSA